MTAPRARTRSTLCKRRSRVNGRRCRLDFGPRVAATPQADTDDPRRRRTRPPLPATSSKRRACRISEIALAGAGSIPHSARARSRRFLARARSEDGRDPNASRALQLALALNDQQARRLRRLLLGKELSRRTGFDQPLAAEMDESEQSPRRE